LTMNSFFCSSCYENLTLIRGGGVKKFFYYCFLMLLFLAGLDLVS